MMETRPMKNQVAVINSNAFPESTIPKLQTSPVISHQDQFFKTLDTVRRSAWEIMQQAAADIQRYADRQDPVPDKLAQRYINSRMMYKCYDDMCSYYKDFKSQNGNFKPAIPMTLMGYI